LRDTLGLGVSPAPDAVARRAALCGRLPAGFSRKPADPALSAGLTRRGGMGVRDWTSRDTAALPANRAMGLPTRNATVFPLKIGRRGYSPVQK
jgi:hypothetical protein